MKAKNYTALVIAILALVLIVYFTLQESGRKKRTFSWIKTYESGKTQPYDFGVFKAMMQNESGTGFTELEDDIPGSIASASPGDSSTYMFIGRYCYLTRPEINALLDFAHAGHDVVLIAEGLPDTLMQTLGYFAKPVSINRFDDNAVVIETPRLYSKINNYRFNFRGYGQDTVEKTDWYYLDEDQQLDYYYGETGNRYLRLGTINDRLNYAKFKVGNGFVYIHTSPLLFTNYALKNDSLFHYTDEILSGIRMKRIYYDVFSGDFKDDAETIQRQSDSPLSYILKQPSLKWAWYLFLTAVLLFFLFRAKRTQRIIPVIEQKRNTSVSFIRTLSGLFYNDANHQKMAETRMNLFLFFLRNKLNISTHDINPATIKLIAVKSKVPEKQIHDILDYYYQVIKGDRNDVQAENLMEFYNRIDAFYQLYNNKK